MQPTPSFTSPVRGHLYKTATEDSHPTSGDKITEYNPYATLETQGGHLNTEQAQLLPSTDNQRRSGEKSQRGSHNEMITIKDLDGLSKPLTNKVTPMENIQKKSMDQ